MAFYAVFEQLCNQRNITPTQVARDNGLTQQTVSHWKTRGSTPKAETVQKLADYFNVSVDYLLGTEKEKAPIPKDEHQKYFDYISDEFIEQKRFLQNMADSTYKFFSEMRTLVGSDKLIPRDIIFKEDETEQVKKEIEELLVKFMETATYEEKVDFILRLNKIGQEFKQQMDSIEPPHRQRPQQAPQSTPAPQEGTDTTPPTDTP